MERISKIRNVIDEMYRRIECVNCKLFQHDVLKGEKISYEIMLTVGFKHTKDESKRILTINNTSY